MNIEDRLIALTLDLYSKGQTDFKLRESGTLFEISNSGSRVFKEAWQNQDYLSAEQYLFRMIPHRLEAFRKNPINSIDAGVYVGEKRVRVVLCRSHAGREMTVRILPEAIPSVQQLNLPPQVIQRFREERNGMILFVGETGSGKTTANAALYQDRFAYRTKGGGLVTLEDPVEYVHPETDRLWVSQLELGNQFTSYRSALRIAMRMHPTDILQQEIRMEQDEETGKMVSSASHAVNTAMSGHLLCSSYHAADPIGGVIRIVGEMRDSGVADAAGMVCSVLRMVIACRLMSNATDTSKVAIHEVLMVNDTIASILRDGIQKGNTNEVRRKIDTNSDGCQSFAESTRRAVMAGLLKHTM